MALSCEANLVCVMFYMTCDVLAFARRGNSLQGHIYPKPEPFKYRHIKALILYCVLRYNHSTRQPAAAM